MEQLARSGSKTPYMSRVVADDVLAILRDIVHEVSAK